MLVRNFLFHRVSPERDMMWDPVDPALFDKCIRYITKNYEVILPEELPEVKDKIFKKEIATISFDDGYKDNLEYAAPILTKYKCPAAFYVSTGCITNNTVTFTHFMEHLFQNTNKQRIELPFDFVPEEFRVAALPGKKERIEFARRLIPWVKTIPHTKRQQVLDKIGETFNDCSLPKLMMNWDEVRQLKSAGFEIGSHTISHHMLGTVEDPGLVKFELEQSAKEIEKELGKFPVTISYPVDSYNEETISLSQKAGYKMGLAVKQKMYDPAIHGIFEIPRIQLGNEPWWKAKMRITHLIEKIRETIKYK